MGSQGCAVTYTLNPNSTLDSGAEANGIFFTWALELCKQKLLHTQGFVIEKVNLYISSFFFPHPRFKKAFESEPTLQSGINYAVLLLAAGHQFESSFELRKVGNCSLIFLEGIKKLDPKSCKGENPCAFYYI